MELLAGTPQPIPLPFFLAFALPVFFVVVWFSVRLMFGRWITDPKPDPPEPVYIEQTHDEE